MIFRYAWTVKRGEYNIQKWIWGQAVQDEHFNSLTSWKTWEKSCTVKGAITRDKDSYQKGLLTRMASTCLPNLCPPHLPVNCLLFLWNPRLPPPSPKLYVPDCPGVSYFYGAPVQTEFVFLLLFCFVHLFIYFLINF